MTTGLPCGCCVPGRPLVPTDVANRPALSAVAFRAGTFATFRQAILDAVAGTPELAPLRTRISEDYTITVVELWAAVADVLTFYQERLANEGFLRTALLRDSVRRLARLIDYQLAPGAAATATLAFTLDRDATLTIPVGLRVQSVPAEGERPQKYETLESLAADGRLNRLRILPAPREVLPLAFGRTGAWLEPGEEMLAAAAALSARDTLLLHRAGINPGDPHILETLVVERVVVDGDRARLEWTPPVRNTIWEATTTPRRVTGTLRLFGHNAPRRFMALAEPPVATPPTLPYWTSWQTDLSHDTTTGDLYLDGLHPEIVAGTRLLIVDRAAVPALTAWEVEVTAIAEGPAPELPSTHAGPVPPPAGTPAPPAPIAGTVTRLTVSPPLVHLADVGQVTLHVLDGPPLRLWRHDLPGFVATPSVYVSGRRSGWDEIEVGRVAERGRLAAGDRVSLGDLPAGRRVLLTDDAGSAVSTETRLARFVGLDLAIEGTETDASSVLELGLAGDGAQRTTVLVSQQVRAFPTNPRRELTVAIGALGPYTISLAGPPVLAWSNLRSTLEGAIRAAFPGSPAFAEARVLDTPDQLVLVVAPGVVGERVVFGPAAQDDTTVVELGLAPQQARHADGVLSASVAPPLALTNPTPPEMRVRAGVLAPRTVSLAGVLPVGPLTDEAWRAQLAANLQGRLRSADAGTLFTSDPSLFNRASAHVLGERLLLLPGIPLVPAAEFLVLDLATAAPLALDARSAALLGNVARASHGETVRPETLGDGDAAAAFQHFTLAKQPVTQVPGAGPSGLVSSLQLLVDDVLWAEVPTLYGRGGDEQVYAARMADDGSLTVRFGDGETGARLPSGRGNVVARYRKGLGLAGRVGAGALTTLLDRPQGLRSATNPLPADGGADPESIEDARANAPTTVRTFGRAVSLRDFEDVVRASGEVARAHATWVWGGTERAVHVTVAGQLGAAFSDDALARIGQTLDGQRDVNIPLRLDNVARVPVVVTATLRVSDAHVASAVSAAARDALLAALAFEAMPFGRAVHLSGVYAVLQGVEGVVSVDVDLLHFKRRDPAFLATRGASADPVQGALRIFPARAVAGPPPAVLPAEQAYVEVPSQDVVLTTIGGLT